MPDLSVWPTDGGAGAVSSEAQWRKMARLWVPSGVTTAAALTPTLAAGPAIQVAAGQCWLDGHFAELATAQTVPATANGLLVVRFTPADNHAELLYRDAASNPTQTDPTWELPIAQMVAGALQDRRQVGAVASGVAVQSAAANVADTVIASASSAAPTQIPGAVLVLPPGQWLLTAQFDIGVTTLSAGNILQAGLGFPFGVIPGNALTVYRTFCDLNAVQRVVLTSQSIAALTFPANIQLNAFKNAAGGVVSVYGTGQTVLTALRYGN